MVELIELLTDARENLKQPEAFTILNDIAKQFRTNNGSSLRDIVNDLTKNVAANSVANEIITISLESAKILAESDRRTAARLEALLNTVLAKAIVSAKASTTAAELAAGVAVDLEDAHKRAEAHTVESKPGEAADAAMIRNKEIE